VIDSYLDGSILRGRVNEKSLLRMLEKRAAAMR
jgi:hypothetical protein